MQTYPHVDCIGVRALGQGHAGVTVFSFLEQHKPGLPSPLRICTAGSAAGSRLQHARFNFRSSQQNDVVIALLQAAAVSLACRPWQYHTNDITTHETARWPLPITSLHPSRRFVATVLRASRFMATSRLEHQRSHVPTSFLCEAARLSTSPQARSSLPQRASVAAHQGNNSRSHQFGYIR